MDGKMVKEDLQKELKEQQKIIEFEINKERKLHQELLKIETEENKNNIGRCFKCKNNYSCPEKDEDYWFLYSKIIDAEGRYYKCIEFQQDSYGICQTSIREKYHTFINDYIEISEYEWNVAVSNHLNTIQKFLYNIK